MALRGLFDADVSALGVFDSSVGADGVFDGVMIDDASAAAITAALGGTLTGVTLAASATVVGPAAPVVGVVPWRGVPVRAWTSWGG